MEIFDFIKKDANDKLSKLDRSELFYLLKLMDKYYIDFRDELNISKNISFGVELEFENIKDLSILSRLNCDYPLKNWHLVEDKSLINGLEVVSPILYDYKNNWNELKTVCLLLEQIASISKNCGSHIHIGAHIIGNDKQTWANLFRLWSVYENIIYRFSYGEYLTERPSINIFAHPIFYRGWNCATMLLDGQFNLDLFILSFLAKFAINLENVDYLSPFKKDNTIEFRVPNGTLNSIIIQNNINFFTKLIERCKKGIDEDSIIDSYFKYARKNDLALYRQINIEQALEFCDIIFDNNLDKINFLRQYLKSCEVGSEYMQKAKVFTRTTF